MLFRSEVQHLQALYNGYLSGDHVMTAGGYGTHRSMSGHTGGYDPKAMNTIYNTKDTCPLAGCKGVGDGLLDNTYNIAFSGPHDRTAEGVAGWNSSIEKMGIDGTKAWTNTYGENYWTSGV